VITPLQLLVIMPQAGAARAQAFAAPLTEAMAEYQIATPRQMAAFLAMVAEESWELQHLKELATGKAYEPPSAVAKTLGNTQPGDGARFIGRGVGQATGRWVYAALQNALHLPLIAQPELLEQIEPACRSAAWIWGGWKKLNPFADNDEFGACCYRWNGGWNGLDPRIKYWLRARKVFGL
jgi:putative chitinase